MKRYYRLLVSFVRCNLFANFKTNIFFFLFIITVSLSYTESVLAEEKGHFQKQQTSEKTLKNLFDKIYVISLDRTPERYEYAKKQLDKFNLKHERYAAVDGKLITIKDVERNQIVPWEATYLKGYHYGAVLKISQQKQYKEAEFFYKTDRYIPNLEEFGCAMSHRAVWTDVVNHGYKRVIILEDDVTLKDSFLTKLSDVTSHLPDDFDVFFLDIALFLPKDTNYFIPPIFWLSKFSNTLSPYFAKIKLNNKNLWGLHAYIVTFDSAKKLLAKTQYINIPIDNALMFSGLKLYVSKIKLLSGTSGKSVIRGNNKK